MHGHSPRVRRKYNEQEDEDHTEISVDTNKLLSQVVSSAIGAVVGAAITRQIYKDDSVEERK